MAGEVRCGAEVAFGLGKLAILVIIQAEGARHPGHDLYGG